MVNRKSVIIGNGDIFCTATVLFAIVPVFVVTGTGGTPGAFQRTAVFLTSPSVIGKPSVFVHSKTCFADRVSACKLLVIFSVLLIERNDAITVIQLFYSVVYCFDVIALVS